MSSTQINSLVTLFCTMLANVLLAVFLISILADGLLKYEVGFWVNTPIILSLFSLLFIVFYKYFTSPNRAELFSIRTILLLILGAINLLMLCFNIVVWLDLFDGKTNALLP